MQGKILQLFTIIARFTRIGIEKLTKAIPQRIGVLWIELSRQA